MIELAMPAMAVISIISLFEKSLRFKYSAKKFFIYLNHQKYTPYEKTEPIMAALSPLYRELMPSSLRIFYSASKREPVLP